MNSFNPDFKSHFNPDYREREYREKIKCPDLISFQVQEDESDLLVQSDKGLSDQATYYLRYFRNILREYIFYNPIFATTLKPYPKDITAHSMIQKMIEAAQICQVGPMAAVAGCIAQYVGENLLKHTTELIIENGGDLYIKSSNLRKVIIYAGTSPLSNQIYLKIYSKEKGVGVCTSSGTVGHSFSMGKADSVTILSSCASLADAAATAICNIVQTKEDIKKGLNLAKTITGVSGIVIIKDDKIGIWGEIEYGFV